MTCKDIVEVLSFRKHHIKSLKVGIKKEGGVFVIYKSRDCNLSHIITSKT